MFFSLLAFHLLRRSKPVHLIAGIGSLVLAMACKEDAAASVLIAWFLMGDEQGRKRWWITLSWLILPLLYMGFRSPHVGTVGLEVQPWFEYLWHQGIHLPLHFSLYFWPWPLTLDRELPIGWFHPFVLLLGWLFVIAWGWLAWKRRQTIWGLGLLWALLSLIPTHSVVPLLDLHATRILFPMLPGLSLSLAALIALLYKKKETWALVLTTVLLTFFATRTVGQIEVWNDPVALWTQDIGAAPSRWRAWLNLSVELAERKQWSKATTAIDQAFFLAPEEPSVLYNAAAISAYREDGKKDRTYALDLLRKTLEIKPNHVRSKELITRLEMP